MENINEGEKILYRWYLKEKIVFLIYGIFGVVCTGLFFFLKETRGMPRADNIKEIEEEMMKEQKIESTNNKESQNK